MENAEICRHAFFAKFRENNGFAKKEIDAIWLVGLMKYFSVGIIFDFSTLCKYEKFTLTDIFPSNQLFSELFSKCALMRCFHEIFAKKA